MANSIDILSIQQKFIDAGYQWEEHIFNDGMLGNCIIHFAKSTLPGYFLEHCLGDFGWGRFDRESCWRQANAWLDKILSEEKGDTAHVNKN